MAIYHYKDSPLISHIEVTPPRHGITQAVIVARENADEQKLEALRQTLGARKLSTLMDMVDGKPAIQVRGFKNAEQLLAAVGGSEPGHGAFTKELTPADHKKPESLRNRVRGKALFLSALFYDLGNAAYIVSGIQRGRHNPGGKFTTKDFSEIGIGLTFGVGDLLMTAYGHDQGDEELKAADQRLKRHLHQKGIEIPPGETLNPDTLYQTGALKATDRWLRKHIIHVKCMTEFVGGLLTIHSGAKPIEDPLSSKKGERNHGKMTAGLLLSTGWLTTFLLDKHPAERALDGDDARASTMGQKMINNPRGWIARPLSMANNTAMLWGALNSKTGERTRGKRILDAIEQHQGTDVSTAKLTRMAAEASRRKNDYIWNVISACSFLVAHTLFGISGSKRPRETEDDRNAMNDIVLLSANVLAKQPEQVREAAIDDTAEFVSKLAHVNMSKEQAAEAIRSKVNALSHSSWVARTQSQASSAAQQTGI